MTYFQIYRNWVLFYLSTNTILATVASFFDLRGPLTEVFLVGLLLFDLGFIAYGILFKKIFLKRFEIVLIALLFLSLCKMLLANPFPFSRRIITDLSNPIMFILKIALLRKCLRESDDLHIFLKRCSNFLLFASLITISVFIFLSRSRSIYIGLTPPIELPFALNLLKGSYLNAFYAFLLTLFSGKRSILLATIVVFIIYYFFVHNKYRILKILVAILLFFAFSAFIPYLLTSQSSAVQKYVFTITTLLDSEISLDSEESFDIFDRVSGGRFSEISYSLQSFSKLDYLLGKGPGYTYKLEMTISDFAESDYSNVHFTPINLYSKYGVFFTALFYYYLLSSLFKRTGNDNTATFFKFLFTMYLVEMLFAFNIFVEPLIPFCMGYLTINNYTKKYA